MNKFSFVQLGKSIQQVFVDFDKYRFDKYVPEFKVNDKYFADCFNITIVEPIEGKAPVFYHTYSPYDIVSKKAPDQALVFQDGELILNTEFASYVKMRTAAMSPMVIKASVSEELRGKLLFIGSGKIASHALRAFKEQFPNLESVSFYNSSGGNEHFIKFASEIGVAAEFDDLNDLSKYDYIICHSSAQTPVLTTAHKDSIKAGAFLASFASENFSELAEEFYDTSEANVIADWEKTISEAPELQSAVDKGIAKKDQILFLHDVFTGKKAIDTSKKYTVYRSHGTPMQNLAVLKTLLAK